MTISKATPDDVSGMQEVLFKAWLETYPSEAHHITVEDIKRRFEERGTPERLAKRRAELANPPQGETCLVAKENGRVVGFCTVINTAAKNQLRAIYVHPDYQGKGIGTALWEEGRKYLDPSRDVELWTASYNEKAKRFYRKLDFEPTGEVDFDENLRLPSGVIIPEMQMVRKVQP